MIQEIKDFLQSHKLIETISDIQYEGIGEDVFKLKIRCELSSGLNFQVWIHKNYQLIRYSYQLFSDVPLLRWDNAPHHRRIETHPHHFHDKDGAILESQLIGSPIDDLKFVLDKILMKIQCERR